MLSVLSRFGLLKNRTRAKITKCVRKQPLQNDLNVDQVSDVYSEYALDRIINDLSRISRLIENAIRNHINAK